MEGIERLRKYSRSWDFDGDAMDRLTAIADEIEAEIAEKYMELPVDADGVPWRDGETRFVNPNGDECRLVSLSFSFIRHEWLLEGEIITKPSDIQRCYAPDECRHVKPRTLEDVLHDFSSSYVAYYFDNEMNYDGTDAHVIAKYAAEIRELMGGAE